MFDFRPVNALDFWDIFKMDLWKIPEVTLSENWDFNSVIDCILTTSEDNDILAWNLMVNTQQFEL